MRVPEVPASSKLGATVIDSAKFVVRDAVLGMPVEIAVPRYHDMNDPALYGTMQSKRQDREVSAEDPDGD